MCKRNVTVIDKPTGLLVPFIFVSIFMSYLYVPHITKNKRFGTYTKTLNVSTFGRVQEKEALSWWLLRSVLRSHA